MRYYLLFILGIAIAFTSCNKHINQANMRSIVPDHIEMRYNADNLELLGTTEVSYNKRIYFGLFHRIDSINGKPVPYRYKSMTNFKGINNLSINNSLKQAAIEVVKKYPNADFYSPVYINKYVNQMFMGRKITEVMKINAYKIKH